MSTCKGNNRLFRMLDDASKSSCIGLEEGLTELLGLFGLTWKAMIVGLGCLDCLDLKGGLLSLGARSGPGSGIVLFDDRAGAEGAVLTGNAKFTKRMWSCLISILQVSHLSL
jgi:hypothetical protein